MDRQRLGDDGAPSDSRATAEEDRVGEGMSRAVCQSARASHGESRAGERAVGCRSYAAAAAFVEVAGWNATRDCVWGFDWNSGLGRAVAGKDSNRIGGRV